MLTHLLQCTSGEIPPDGFEPPSHGSRPRTIDHYTMGVLHPQRCPQCSGVSVSSPVSPTFLKQCLYVTVAGRAALRLQMLFHMRVDATGRTRTFDIRLNRAAPYQLGDCCNWRWQDLWGTPTHPLCQQRASVLSNRGDQPRPTLVPGHPSPHTPLFSEHKYLCINRNASRILNTNSAYLLSMPRTYTTPEKKNSELREAWLSGHCPYCNSTNIETTPAKLGRVKCKCKDCPSEGTVTVKRRVRKDTSKELTSPENVSKNPEKIDTSDQEAKQG